MMNVWGMTDVGLTRQENQDAYAVYTDQDNGFTVGVVCDGMGGPGGGKLASELAVETFLAVCRERLRADMSARNVQTVAESAVQEANAVIYRRACSDRLWGMGTTLVAALILPGAVCMANIGDSRGYVLENDSIRQVTADHSLVQLLVDRGEITPAQARVHPQKNLITRALGVDSEVECDLTWLEPGEGGRLLLCSDGLTNVLEDETILELSGREGSPEGLCRALLSLTLERGAPDNVTVVLAQL